MGLIEDHVDQNIGLLKGLRDRAHAISEIADAIAEALRAGGKLLLFGNGGSAADAQHLAAEFVGRFKLERKGLAAIALTTNSSCLTSIGNDYGFRRVFSRQVEAIGKTGDVALAISTSGNSESVIEGVNTAKEMGIKTIGFCGGEGGKLAQVVDIPFVVPAPETANVQEMHITAGHIICEIVEQELGHNT